MKYTENHNSLQSNKNEYLPSLQFVLMGRDKWNVKRKLMCFQIGVCLTDWFSISENEMHLMVHEMKPSVSWNTALQHEMSAMQTLWKKLALASFNFNEFQRNSYHDNCVVISWRSHFMCRKAHFIRWVCKTNSPLNSNLSLCLITSREWWE